ncbi:hypothetical protein T492DRAFT_1118405 [Pavlovales sp. CCMP2436]|nr:hypothetical protein T492DRAFT_1118405 [Pavlovales sp. CCMP2436]
MPRMDGPLRLTDLPAETLESVLALAAPRDIASALRSCHALSRLDPWRSAFETRWGPPGVKPRASVGKMAYLLRDVCELVSGGSALAKARHRACYDMLEAIAMDLEENRPWFGLVLNHAHPPDQSRARTLRDVGELFAQCATSVVSARVLLAALTQGLDVMLDRTNNCSLADDRYVKHFVLASPRGDLVAFHSSVVGTYHGNTHESRKWVLHATVIGVVDEPRLAEAMHGSLGMRGQKLLSWFDGLLLGGSIVDNAKLPTPPPGCGELLRLSIEPPPSPAIVGSLLDSLGLGEGTVHLDDLLLALFVISDMVPASRVAEVWVASPDAFRWEDYNSHVWIHPGVCLWSSCCSPASTDSTDERLEWDGAPTCMT